jgi:uncharacterized protein (DUF2147 family)
MNRIISLAALVLLSTSAHAGTFSFEVEGHTVRINALSGCASLSCISVSSAEFHGTDYYRRSRTKRASKGVSTREDKARAPAAEPNSLSLAKTTKAEDAIAPPRSPKLTADLRPIVVSTEPTKAPLIHTPSPPATAVATLPSSTDSIAVSGPNSLTKPMPVDATSAGSPSPVDVAAGPPRPSSPSTIDSATLPTSTVYKPVKTALSPAPAVEYYRKTALSPTPAVEYYRKTALSPAPALEYYRKAEVDERREMSNVGRPASLLGNWQTEGKKRSIHIEQCGLFVCGYAADSSNEEKVLINLKPTSSSEWTGLIVSAESGIMYPSVVILEDALTIRVRACALGITFCEGQIWTREATVPAAVH